MFRAFPLNPFQHLTYSHKATASKMGEETEKKKKKSKTKEPKEEDPDKKKKKKKPKTDDGDEGKKKDKKDKKKKKREEDTSAAVVSDDEKPKDKRSSSDKRSTSKKVSPSQSKIKEWKGPVPELFDAAPGVQPTEDAKKYGDVTSQVTQKKCKKLYKLLNFEPWNEARRFDDDDFCDYVLDNPEPCKIKFEFDGFSGCIYPFSMCYALKASLDTVEAVYDAFPPAIKESDWWIGTPYHYAGAYGSQPDIVRFLIQKDPKGVEAINYYGRTALHMGAIFKAPVQSMEILCNKYPMACQIKDKDGYIPLHLACENGAGHEVVAMLLKAYPLSVYASVKYGMTPLHFAASHNPSLSTIRVLLDAAADNAVCKRTDLLGHTPLHMALMSLARLEVVELLVSFCPEAVWMKTSKGELPLEIAERKRAPSDVVKLLEKVMERILLGGS